MNIFKRVRALNKAKKPDMVLTISRFDPSKNVERILDIATATNSNVKFKVVGAAESYSYVYALKRRINELHLSERVSIETNISETRKIEHLATSSMYLHPMLGEHFGISILEAMASGCIPCAPKIGGPSEVIPSKFLYRSTEEAAAIIDNYADYSNSALRDFLVSSSFEYDKSIFEGRIRQIIESI
jgi:glycosyltransferase involved in cell wall biosynthesis